VAVVSMLAGLAEEVGAAAVAAVAGEAVVGDGADPPWGFWASAWVWDLRKLMAAGVRAGDTVEARVGTAATRACAGGKSGLVGVGAWCQWTFAGDPNCL
jgi:hypothetical protein